MYLQGMTVPLLDDPTVCDAASTDMTDIVWVIVFTCINLFIVCHTDIVRVMNDRMAECHYGYIAMSVGHRIIRTRTIIIDMCTMPSYTSATTFISVTRFSLLAMPSRYVLSTKALKTIRGVCSGT